MLRGEVPAGLVLSGGHDLGGRALLSDPHVPPLRSPEPSKTSTLGSSEDGMEPVSPPEGLAEPGHPRSAMFPLLYREGETGESR